MRSVKVAPSARTSSASFEISSKVNCQPRRTEGESILVKNSMRGLS